MRHLRALQYVSVVVCLAASLYAPNVSAASQQEASEAPGQVIVRLTHGADVSAFARQNRLKVQPGSYGQLAKNDTYLFQIEDGASPKSKSKELSANSSVSYAEPNYVGQIPETRQRSSWAVGGQDTIQGYQAQWAPATIHLSQAQTKSRGAGVTIAVLDTGVDLTHPQLAAHLVDGYDFVDSDTSPAEIGVAGTDWAYGHGTHIAGILALVAPDAKIMPLRTLNSDGTGTLWNQLNALQYAADHGANVVNLSWSFSTRSQTLESMLSTLSCINTTSTSCQTSIRPGIVIAAAAGNSASSQPEYPAASNLPTVASVAASTSSDTLASFSTYGSWVTLAAPGEGIVSTVPGGGYASWSGTSMATPFVAATLALVRSSNPAINPTQSISQIKTTCTKITGQVTRRMDAGTALGK